MAAKKQLSIQAEARKYGKSVGAYLNEKSRKGAYNAGAVWSDDDVATIVAMIDHDDTTFDMAVRLGRTYYGAANARSHIAFCMRHWDVIDASMMRKASR
jgi:hypothetical protein